MISPRLRAIAKEAEAAAGPGGIAFFKWTCSGCGERAVFDEPYTMYTQAVHTEKADHSPCGHITDLNKDLLKADVGYLLVLREVPVTQVSEQLVEAIKRRDNVRERN